jgi:outer membrane protein TolC
MAVVCYGQTASTSRSIPSPTLEANADPTETAIRIDLDEALGRAVENSDVLGFARQDYRIGVVRHGLSLRSFLPDIILGYAQEDSVAYYAPDSHLRRISLGVDQLIYAGGRRIHQRRMLADQLVIQQSHIEKMEQELRLEVVNRYIEILKLKLQIAILEENLATGAEQIAIAEVELRLGEITRLDYVEIVLAVQDLEIELALLKQEEKRLVFEIKEMLGIEATRVVDLAGTINSSFEGLLKVERKQYYIDAARGNSFELQRRMAELAARQAALRQAQKSWLPRISTQAEISVSGEGFPLASPGFSLGLSLDFSTPFVPFRTGITAGSDAIGERSLGMTSSADVGENLEGVQSVRIARIDLQKTQAEMQSYERRLEFSVRQQLETRFYLLENLRLGVAKLELQIQRHAIQALMLEIGEITRLEYLHSGIELTRLRIEQLSRIVSLFQLETSLLALCGSDMLESSHNYILLAEEGR